MIRAGVGLLLVIAAVAAIAGNARADEGIYCGCLDQYNGCRQQGKSAQYCEAQRDRCQDEFHCMGNGGH